MDLGRRGYIYTLLVAIVAVSFLSVVYFYLEVVESFKSDDMGPVKIRELQNHVKSIKGDFRRATTISTQRALVYSVNRVLVEKNFLSEYEMTACNAFPGYVHPVEGAPSAVSELMLCGTWEGGVGESTKYMGDHTLELWMNKTRNWSALRGYDTQISFRNITLTPYGYQHLLVSAQFDLLVSDDFGGEYFDENLFIHTLVPLEGIEDPYYVVNAGSDAVSRPIRFCSQPPQASAEVILGWVDEGCYLKSPQPFSGPGFLDRLDGADYTQQKYLDLAGDARDLDLGGGVIGLESLVDEHSLRQLDLSTENSSQIDYLYFEDNTDYFCEIPDARKLRMDLEHIRALNVSGGDVVCDIIVEDDEGSLN
ncbi:MAG: hypothetical protein GF334_05830, partial [Candidatus Altiarchaeales archaeon]|nr:hypothetical protein [Candidatus Altiarchaeales archaeon]